MNTVMKLILTITVCLGAAFASTYQYNINDYIDDAVEEFNLKVVRGGDEYVALDDSLTIAGFVLSRPKLWEMSSLERAGDAWLVPLQNGVEVRANFSFGKFHIDGESLKGPGKDLEKPRISARINLVEVISKGSAETINSWTTNDGRSRVTKKCYATYAASLTKLSSVVLVARDEVTSLENWADGLLYQIREQLDPILTAVFEKHFDLCQSLRSKGYRLWDNN